MARRQRRRKIRLPEEPVTLKIQRLSHDGRGIASVDGKIAFVAGGLPGETVTARYTASRGKFDELDTETVLEASAQRVEPRCPVFHRCGGCSLQHLHKAAQIEFKQQALLEMLTRSTGSELAPGQQLDCVVAESYHYRRKARLAVRYVNKKGGALVGFREKHGTFITEMDDCPVLAAPVAALIAPLRDLVDRLQARSDIPQIEVAVGELSATSDQLQVALVLRHLRALDAADIEQLLNFARDRHCDLYLQPGNAETIHKLWPPDSPSRLYYYLPDYQLQLEFHPVDFTQVNAGINRQIVPLALSLLDVQPEDRVLDLFCGLGNFTLALARHCREVVGIEGSAAMVQRGQENALRNGISNASFHVANLCESFAGAPWVLDGFQRILLDPPRSGAEEIIPLIAGLCAVKLVYISCNPATLARDASALQAHGYYLSRAGVLDMFPHTAHVESIAVFEPGRKRGNK